MIREPLKETKDPLVQEAVPAFAEKMALRLPTDGADMMESQESVRGRCRAFVVRTLIWASYLILLVYLAQQALLMPDKAIAIAFVIGLLFVGTKAMALFMDGQPVFGSIWFTGVELGIVLLALPFYHALRNDVTTIYLVMILATACVVLAGLTITEQVGHLRRADLRVDVSAKRGTMIDALYVAARDTADSITMNCFIAAALLLFGGVGVAVAVVHFGAGSLMAVAALLGWVILLLFMAIEGEGWGAAWRGITSFLTYNLHEAYGPGTFQFPEKWFWVTEHRRVAVVASVLVIAIPIIYIVNPNPTNLLDAASNVAWGPKTKPDPTVPTVVRDIDIHKDYPSPSKRLARYPDYPTEQARTDAYAKQSILIARERDQLWAALYASLLQVVGTIAAALILSPLIAFSAFAVIFGPVLEAFEKLPKAPAEKSTLDLVLDHTLTSAVPEERNALYFGQSLYGDHPVFLDQDLFMRPGIIRGKPRTGKTSLLESMTYQVLRANAPERVQWLKANGLPYKPQKIVIVDMKGEDRWLQGTLEECKRLGIRCRVFTLKPGRESCLFNFFAQSRLDEISTIDFTATLLKGMGLDHDSSGHGVDFWDNMNQIVAVNTLRQRYDLNSFWELHDFLTRGEYKGEKREIENASHLIALSQFLSFVPQLNLTENDCADKPDVWRNQIDVPSLLSGRTEVVYFHLDTVTQRKASVAAAKLFTMCLFGAICNRKPGDDAHIVGFFDEFQQIVSSNIDQLLEMGSSRGMSMILSHQHREQLRETRGVDIRAIADACSAWMVHFDWSDYETLKLMSDLSPKARIATMSFTQEISTVTDFNNGSLFHPGLAASGPMGPVVTVSEKEAPVYHWNELKILSALPNVAIFRPTVLKGLSIYEDLFPFVWQHHVSREVATRREKAVWPRVFPGAFLPPLEYEPTAKRTDKPTPLDERIRKAAEAKKGGKS